jgi:hypothetical protein
MNAAVRAETHNASAHRGSRQAFLLSAFDDSRIERFTVPLVGFADVDGNSFAFSLHMHGLTPNKNTDANQTQPRSKKTQGTARDGVPKRQGIAALHNQVDRLIRERREGCIATKNADHKKEPISDRGLGFQNEAQGNADKQ